MDQSKGNLFTPPIIFPHEHYYLNSHGTWSVYRDHVIGTLITLCAHYGEWATIATDTFYDYVEKVFPDTAKLLHGEIEIMRGEGGLIDISPEGYTLLPLAIAQAFRFPHKIVVVAA